MFGYKGQANEFTTLPPEIGLLYMTGIGMFKGKNEGARTKKFAELPESILQNLLTVVVDQSAMS